jgi:hypothetical protein
MVHGISVESKVAPQGATANKQMPAVSGTDKRRVQNWRVQYTGPDGESVVLEDVLPIRAGAQPSECCASCDRR